MKRLIDNGISNKSNGEFMCIPIFDMILELLRVRNSESSVVGQLYYNLKMLFKDTCRIDVD